VLALLSHALTLSADLLRCPKCAHRLHPASGALRCPAGHTFNIGRHGYASLLSGTRPTSGDEPAMVAARQRFLATGSYAPIRRAVTGLAGDGGTVVDVGCGTGYYLAGVLDHLPAARGLGLDTSVRAARSTAKAHARAAAATWDVFRPLPLADGVADVVLNVFAPRNPAEFHRVLRRGGTVVVVRPTARHLAELPGAVRVDPRKEERLSQALDGLFTAATTEDLTYPLALSSEDIANLVGMTPTARHAGALELPAQDVTVSVLVTAYRAR
jgi:23S rRNA (guanine745-N1)-methyltransferase